MPKKKKGNKKVYKKIAISRIQQLFRLAEQRALCGQMNLADRYVFLARKISMRYLVPIPREFKRCFCKHCYRYLLPGVSGRMRIHRGRIVVYCFNCKKYTRMPLKNRLSKSK